MGILNSLTASSEAAYSLRKLLTAYSGSSIRVRESGGDTETDIGFDGNGDLDTTALLTHCGSNDGFVVTWYDQSGNSYDATKATDSNQPQIVSSGSVLVDSNSNPKVVFDKTNSTNVQDTAFTSNVSQALTYNIVYQRDANGQFVFDGGSASNRVGAGHLNNTTNFEMFAGSVVTAFTESTPSHNYVTMLFNGSGSESWLNGISQGTNNPGTNAAGGITIGARYNGASGLNGFIQELILFGSDIGATDRGTLEADQDSYWINPPAGVEITHTAGAFNFPTTSHTVVGIEPVAITHTAGTFNMPTTTHTISIGDNVEVTHTAGIFNFPVSTHTIVGASPVEVTHTAGTFNFPQTSHAVFGADSVTITHIAGTFNFPTVSHSIAVTSAVEVTHTAGTFNFHQTIHTIIVTAGIGNPKYTFLTRNRLRTFYHGR